MRVASTALALCLTITTAFVLYAESITTRQLERRIDEKTLSRAALEDEIATLRARRAELARPARIERAARNLGLRPLDPSAGITLSEATPTTPATQ